MTLESRLSPIRYDSPEEALLNTPYGFDIQGSILSGNALYKAGNMVTFDEKDFPQKGQETPISLQAQILTLAQGIQAQLASLHRLPSYLIRNAALPLASDKTPASALTGPVLGVFETYKRNPAFQDSIIIEFENSAMREAKKTTPDRLGVPPSIDLQDQDSGLILKLYQQVALGDARRAHLAFGSIPLYPKSLESADYYMNDALRIVGILKAISRTLSIQVEMQQKAYEARSRFEDTGYAVRRD